MLKKKKPNNQKNYVTSSSRNSNTSKKPKSHRRTVSDIVSLAPLQGSIRKKAPSVYENQIFADVYDEFGNHDRVLETIESIELYQESNKVNKLEFNSKSELSTEKIIQPDNSYKSVENTSPNIEHALV